MTRISSERIKTLRAMCIAELARHDKDTDKQVMSPHHHYVSDKDYVTDEEYLLAECVKVIGQMFDELKELRRMEKKRNCC